ncbi:MULTISPECIES: DUF1513 domain-containing protein [Rhodomicrobium]|uniref:DUF1513 domain-containing protein n=1 Tax=Rhodomicrobium TaxID=1068 RepID=UPI000B4C1265|nr:MULTISPECIES: DUF1513 domain-containing protein [Rhodomicrobium]
MNISRRDFLAGALAAGALPMLPGAALALADAPSLYAASRREADGSYAAVLFTAEGDRARLALPARGHDLTFRPGTGDCVVFARRPGTFAAVFSRDDAARPPLWFSASEGRHFDGHGVFSGDGRLLYSTENDFTGDASRGVIGVRDAGAGYKPVGEFPSAGMDPHDMALLSDGRTLVVANGGIELDPETGRTPLNLATMEPSLVYIDTATGDIIEKHVLDKALHKLSIRHLAVAAGDLVAFGCQYEGAAEDFPPLVGFHRLGERPLLMAPPHEIHRGLKNYIGSVAADASGTLIAASAPKGGRITFWDAESRRFLGEERLIDGCGVADAAEAGNFVLTSGEGCVIEHSLKTGASHADASLDWSGVSWDNHVIRLW